MPHPLSFPGMTGESQPSMAGPARSAHCTRYGWDLQAGREGKTGESERRPHGSHIKTMHHKRPGDPALWEHQGWHENWLPKTGSRNRRPNRGCCTGSATTGNEQQQPKDARPLPLSLSHRGEQGRQEAHQRKLEGGENLPPHPP